MCSAMMGQVVADLIYERSPTVPIDLFHPKRLTEPSGQQYGYFRYL